MSKLNLSVAIGDYDRNRPLIDGAVQIDGVDPVFMKLYPEEIFFRAFRAEEFDICECSLSSFSVKTAAGNCPYVGVPAFVSRMFRHTSMFCRTDRIKKPEDLKGKKIGLPEYQLTANVWARAILEDDFGVKPSDMHWIRGGIEHAGRPEKITIKLPDGVRLDNAPEGKTISQLLADGEIDGFMAPRPPAIDEQEHRLAVPRSGRGGQGLLQAHENLPDHASDWRAADPGGKTSVAAGGGAEGVRAVEGSRRWRTFGTPRRPRCRCRLSKSASPKRAN